MTCQGCIDLDKGEGGENQMAHMDVGGCLYIDEFETDEHPKSTSALDKYLKASELDLIMSCLMDKSKTTYKHIHYELNSSYRLADIFIGYCKKHDYKKMRQMLKEGYDINSTVGISSEWASGSHFSALHSSVYDKDCELTCWLLQYGAHFNVASYYKYGYVDEFIDCDEIDEIYKTFCDCNLYFTCRSFDSFKYCLEHKYISINKDHNRILFENLEYVFEYIKEDYEMGFYFNKEFHLDDEFKNIRKFMK